MQNLYPNPDYDNPRNPQRAFSFLKKYYREYQKSLDNPDYVWRPSHKDPEEELINKFYFEGYHIEEALIWPYDEFKNYLVNGIPSYLYSKYKTPERSYLPVYYRRRGKDFIENPTHFRERLKYRKQVDHKKKIRDKQYLVKQEWRKKKGMDRDKRKSYSRSYKGVPRGEKTFCNRQHRRWEQRHIYYERWEALWTRKNKMFFDPWHYY